MASQTIHGPSPGSVPAYVIHEYVWFVFTQLIFAFVHQLHYNYHGNILISQPNFQGYHGNNMLTYNFLMIQKMIRKVNG